MQNVSNVGELVIDLVYLVQTGINLGMLLSTVYKKGNSGDVSQGRCGGGAPYCGPRGARFN